MWIEIYMRTIRFMNLDSYAKLGVLCLSIDCEFKYFFIFQMVGRFVSFSLDIYRQSCMIVNGYINIELCWAQVINEGYVRTWPCLYALTTSPFGVLFILTWFVPCYWLGSGRMCRYEWCLNRITSMLMLW